MILMVCHALIFQKLGKLSQNLSSAAVVIGALRANKKCFCSKFDGILLLKLKITLAYDKVVG